MAEDIDGPVIALYFEISVILAHPPVDDLHRLDFPFAEEKPERRFIGPIALVTDHFDVHRRTGVSPSLTGECRGVSCCLSLNMGILYTGMEAIGGNLCLRR